MKVLPKKSGKGSMKPVAAMKKAASKRNPVKAAKSTVKAVKRTSGAAKSGNRMMAGSLSMKAMAQPGMGKKPVSPTTLVQQGVAKHVNVPNTRGMNY